MEKNIKFRVSAPSKVLITGGYLIIDPINEGIVISTDAKFHADTLMNQSPSSEGKLLTIECSQTGEVFNLKIRPEGFDLSGVTNSFLRKTLIFYLCFFPNLNKTILESCYHSIHIKLFGDFAFYSHRKRLQKENKEMTY